MGHLECALWARIALYSFAAALAGLSLCGVEQSFALPADAPDTARTFHRGISESVSIASTFASPSVPNHYVRAMSESINVQPAFPGQPQPAAATPRAPMYPASVGPRIDERPDLALKNLKRGDPQARVPAGTPYLYEELPPVQVQPSFDDMVEAPGESAEPDDILALAALAGERALAQQSLQGTSLVNAGTYGVTVLGALALAAADRSRVHIMPAFKERRVRPLAVALAAIAAGSAAHAGDPLVGRAFADTSGAGMVYIEGDTPKYREWVPFAEGDGAWSNAVSLPSADEGLRAAKIEFSPVSVKRVIVTMDAGGRLDSYVCSSSCTDAGSWTHEDDFVDVAGSSVTASYRPWDIEYEQTSGDLMIVYDYVEGGSNASDDLFYRVMTASQTAFGSPASINDSGNSATAGLYSFVAMDSRKTAGSNEMALVALDATASDVIAMVWNGSNWTSLPQTELSTSASTATRESVAIAYESSSGDILVVAGEGSGIRHNTFSNTSNTWGTSSTSTGTWGVGTLYWVGLVPDPRGTSNAVFLAGLGSSNDLDSAYWSGSAWTDHAEHDDGVSGSDRRYFDFAWDGSSSNGLLAWSTATNSIAFTRGNPSSGSFGTDGMFTVDSGGNNAASWIRLETNPAASDTVAALGLEDDANSDIGGIRWDGGAETPVTTGADGISATSTNNGWEPFDMDFQAVQGSQDTSRSVSDSVAVGDGLAAPKTLTRSVSDALSASDSASRAKLAFRLVSDTVELADSPAKTKLALRATSDALAVSDAAGRNSLLAASPSDAVGVADSTARALAASRSASETVAMADAITANTSVNISISETLSAADSIARALSAARTAAESLAVTDVTSTRAGFARSAAESIAAADSVARRHMPSRSVSDAVLLADGAERNNFASASVSDSLAVASSLSRAHSAVRTMSDSLDAAESLAPTKSFVRAMSDAAALTDEMTRNSFFAASMSDGTEILDSADAALSATRSAEETVITTDAIERSNILSESLSESIDVSDALAREQSALRQLQETLVAGDAVERNSFVRVPISDGIDMADSAARAYSGEKLIEEMALLSDEVERNNFVSGSGSETIAATDAITATVLAGRPNADAVPVDDAISAAASFGRSVADSVSLADETARNNFALSPVADSVAVSDALETAYVAARPVADALAVQESAARNDISAVSIVDALGVSDGASTGFFRSLGDTVAASDEMAPPVAGAARQLFDSVVASDGFAQVSVQWNRSFEEGLGIGECTPLSCNQSLRLDESLSIAGAFSGPPKIGDGVSLSDTIVAAKSFGSAPADSLVVTDSLGYVAAFAPPAAQEGIPALGAIVATSTGAAQPLAARQISGTYSMTTGNPNELISQLNLPVVDVQSIASLQAVLVLPTYHVALTPSQLVPADDSAMTILVSQIPADTPVLVPIDVAGTAQMSEHAQVQWMKLEYTPAVDSNNFALLITPLEQPPENISAFDLAPLYIDVRWVGDFGAENPGTTSYYAEAPTFTFAVTEEWASSQGAKRDIAGVPVITLNLLDESTGQWVPVDDIDMPAGAQDGQYVYVAHLEHFSTYAVAAEKSTASSGGSSSAGESIELELGESIAVADAAKGSTIGVIEEFAGKTYSANLQDSFGIASKPVAYKVLPVYENLDVLIALEGVEQNTGIPPSAKATFAVNINNAGDTAESFTLQFWYNDERGVRTFESSREISVAARKSLQEKVEITFASAGTFEVTIEARSAQGIVLNTAQMTVAVPWITVNFWLLMVVAIAIIGESAAMVVYLMRRKRVAVAVGGQTVVVSGRRTRIGMAAWPSPVKTGSDVQLSVRMANATGKRVLAGTLTAEVEFEIKNTSDRPQEFILACWFEHGTDNWYQRIQLGPHGSDVRRAEVSMPSRGRHILRIETRDSEYGELLGMLRVGASSY